MKIGRNKRQVSSRRKSRRDLFQNQLHRQLTVEALEDRRMLAVAIVDTSSDVIDALPASLSSISALNSNPGPDGLISLREAVVAANSTPEADEIQFDPSIDGTPIVLTTGLSGEDVALQGDLDITQDLTITGNGPGNTIIDGNANDRVLDVQIGTMLTLTGVTVRNGAEVNGAGIRNRGGLMVTDSVIGTAAEPNVATGNGGGIWDMGTMLVITNTTIQNNTAVDGGGLWTDNSNTVTITGGTIVSNLATDDGGGIYNAGTGTLTLENTMVGMAGAANMANNGGGISNEGTLNVTNSIVAENIAAVDGGGIENRGTVTLLHSKLVGNSAVLGDGGGVDSVGSGSVLNIIGSMISGNSAGDEGGGVWADSTTAITDSTIDTNTAVLDGGGVWADRMLQLTNSTISSNRANGNGGGIHVEISATVTSVNVTITQNHSDNDDLGGETGGGVFIEAGAAVTLHNTIVAQNFRGSGTIAPDDVHGVLQSASMSNLIGVDSDDLGGTDPDGLVTGTGDVAGLIPGMGNKVGTMAVPIDPMLGPLADNGGPLLKDGMRPMTHRLMKGSVAIDMGSSMAAMQLAHDQRGEGYPRMIDFDGVDMGSDGIPDVDIGALEFPAPDNNDSQPKALDLGTVVHTLIPGMVGPVLPPHSPIHDAYPTIEKGDADWYKVTSWATGEFEFTITTQDGGAVIAEVYDGLGNQLASGVANSASQGRGVTQLGFALDSSGSVGSTNWNTILTGLGNSLTAVVPTDSSVEITVVSFGTSVATIVPPTLIDSATTLTTVVGAIAGAGFDGGGTNMSGGINQLTSLVTGSPIFSQPSTQIFNIVTDGSPNSTVATTAAASAAVAAGIDEIDAEAIGSANTSFLQTIAYPQPGTLAPPFQPGFVLPVTNFEAFPEAVESKVASVLGRPTVAVPVLKGQMLWLRVVDDPSDDLEPDGGQTAVYSLDIASNDMFDTSGAQNDKPANSEDLGMIVHYEKPELTVPWGDEDWFKFTTWADDGSLSIWVDMVDTNMNGVLDPQERLIVELWKDTDDGWGLGPDMILDTDHDTKVAMGRVDGFSLHIDDYPAAKNEMFWLRVVGDASTMSQNEYDLDIVNDDRFDRERSGLFVVDIKKDPVIANIFEINPDTGAVLRTLPVPELPDTMNLTTDENIGLAYDGTALYYVAPGGPGCAIDAFNHDCIYTLDDDTGAVLNIWSAPGGSFLTGLAADGTNHLLYAVDPRTDTVYTITIDDPLLGPGAVKHSVIITGANLTGGLGFRASDGVLLADAAGNRIVEIPINQVTGLPVNNVTVMLTLPPANSGEGIAALGDRLFTTEFINGRIHEVDPADGTSTNMFPAPYGAPLGLGAGPEELTMVRNDLPTTPTDLGMSIHIEEAELTVPWGDDDWFKVTTWADGTVDVRVTLVDHNMNGWIDPEELLELTLWSDLLNNADPADMTPDGIPDELVATAKLQGFDLVIAHVPAEKMEMFWVHVTGVKKQGPYDDTILVVERDDMPGQAILPGWGAGFQPGGRLLRYDQDGNVIQVIDPGDSGTVNGLSDTLNAAARAVFGEGVISDVEIGPNGDIYVSMDVTTRDPISGVFTDGIGQGGQLVQFDAFGNLKGLIPFTYMDPADGLVKPLRDNAPNGNLAANFPFAYPNSVTPNSFFFAFGFDVAPDGTIWLAMPNSNRVAHVNAMGKLIEIFEVMKTPDEVAFDPGADLNDPSDDRVVVGYREPKPGFGEPKIDLLNPNDGTLQTIVTHSPAGFSNVNGAFGINFNMEGNFWYSDHLNGVIVESTTNVNSLVDFKMQMRPIDPEEDWKGNVWTTFWDSASNMSGNSDDVRGLQFFAASGQTADNKTIDFDFEKLGFPVGLAIATHPLMGSNEYTLSITNHDRLEHNDFFPGLPSTSSNGPLPVDSPLFNNVGLGTPAKGNFPVNVSTQPGPMIGQTHQLDMETAVNPTNTSNVVIASSSRDSSVDPSRSYVDVYASFDGGHTWMRTRIDDSVDGSFASVNPIDREDPSIAADRWGNFYLTYRATDTVTKQDWIVVARSTDGGMTFGATAGDVAVVATGDPAEFGFDNPQIAVGPQYPDATTGLQERDDVFVSWTRRDVAGSTSDIYSAGSRGATMTSTSALDFGFSTTSPATTGDKVNDPPFPGKDPIPADFSDIAVGPTGWVTVVWQALVPGAENDLLKGDTDPDGLNPAQFNVDFLIHNLTVDSGSNPSAQPEAGVNASPSIDVDRSGGPFNGRAYIVFASETGSSLNAYLRTSDNINNPLSVDFSSPMTIHSTSYGDQFNPSVAVDQVTGEVVFTWLDARFDDNGGSHVVAMAAKSPDGGVTKGNEFVLARGLSDQSGIQPPSEDFGNYIGVAAYGGWSFYAWPDNSPDPGKGETDFKNDLDVYFNAIHMPTQLPLDPEMPELVMAEWVNELTLPWFDEDWFKFDLGETPWGTFDQLKIVLDLEDVDGDGLLGDKEKLVVELYRDADGVDDPNDPYDFQRLVPSEFFYLGDEPGDPLIDDGQFRMKAFFDLDQEFFIGEPEGPSDNGWSSVSLGGTYFLRVFGGPISSSSLPWGASQQEDLQSVILGNPDAVMGSNEYDLHIIPAFYFDEDYCEPNDNIEHPCDLGSETEIILSDLTIHATAPSVTNDDWFKVTAHSTGKLVINAMFVHNPKVGMGDLDMDVLKINDQGVASVVAIAHSTTDNEQIIIPVVAGEDYYIRVFGFPDPMTGHTFANAYSLEIENFPVPAPVLVSLVPLNPMSPGGGMTSDPTPDLVAFAPDLTNFAMGIPLDDQAKPGKFDVQIMLQDTGGSTMVSGDATLVNGAWQFTVPDANMLLPGIYLVTAKVLVEDPGGATDVSLVSPPYILQVKSGTGAGSISGLVCDDLSMDNACGVSLAEPDVVFVVDNSNSTINPPKSAPGVLDENNDGRSETILDAEIAAFIALNAELGSLMNDGSLSGNTRVSVIAFSFSATNLDLDPVAPGVQLAASPLADADSNGELDVVQALRSIQAVQSGPTDYGAALTATINTFDSLSTAAANGLMVFVSDGQDNALGTFETQVATLNSAGHTLRAFGIGTFPVDPPAPQQGLIDIDPMAMSIADPTELLQVLVDLPSSLLEPGVPDVQVFIDANNNGTYEVSELSTVTGADGTYLLSPVPQGTHVVRALPPVGKTITFPAGGAHTLTVGPDENVTGINFGDPSITEPPDPNGSEVLITVEYRALDGSPLPTSTVNVGQEFLVAITVQDLIDDGTGDNGVVGLTVDMNWAASVLNEAHADFAGSLDSIITSDFPVSRSGTLDQASGLIDELGGGASTIVGAGSAIGIAAADTFAVLRFIATGSGNADVQLDLGSIGAILGDNTITRNVTIDVPTLTVLDTVGVTDTSGATDDGAIRFGTPLSQYRTDSIGNPWPDSFLVRPALPDDRHSVEITNSGQSPLTLREVIINAPDVAVTPQLNASAADDIVLQPGESISLQLTYAPTAPQPGGAATQSFNLADGIQVVTDVSTINIALQGDSTFDSDVNYDGVVNFPDFSILNGRREGAKAGDADFDPTSDFNGDGVYNLLDLPRFNSEFGLARSGQPLHASSVAPKACTLSEPLTANDVESVLATAVDVWQSARPPEETAILDLATVLIADLDGTQLGETVGTVILIDRDAAGFGWFVGAIPSDPAEFDADRAVGKVDLLTVLVHELGHLLGQPDLQVPRHGSDPMAATLRPGERHLPSSVESSGELEDLVELLSQTQDSTDSAANDLDLFFAEFGDETP